MTHPRPAPSLDHEVRLALPPEEFLQTLQGEERLVLRLRDELYESSWERMEKDLRNRLAGKPYIFKLVHRIETDLALIALLRAYEARHGVDLQALLG